MSESNLVQVSYVKEATWGTTPASNLQVVRRTGGTFSPDLQTTASAEVRKDRMIAAIRNVGQRPSGSMEIELPYGSHDDLLEGAMMSAWTSGTDTGPVATISAAVSDNSYNDTGTGFTQVAGQWINVSGFTQASGENNGPSRIVSATTAKLIVDSRVALTDETLGDSVTIEGSDYLRNGVTFTSFSIEELYDEAGGVGSDLFMSYVGYVCGSINLDISAENLVTGSFADGMAKIAARPAATIGSGYDAANSNTPVSAVSEIELFEAGAASSFLVSTFSVAMTNNLRGIPVVGSDALGAIRLGTCDVTGNWNVYWGSNSETLVDKHLALTASFLSAKATDEDGNMFIVTVPNLRYTSGAPEAGGLDADVPVNMGFQAERDAVTACVLQFDRIAAP
jgi:hypothetical protein